RAPSLEQIVEPQIPQISQIPQTPQTPRIQAPQEQRSPAPEPPRPSRASPLPSPPPLPRQVDSEQWFGQRGLLGVGVIFLILAVGYLLKLSFDRGWISPAARCAGGA